VIWPKIDYRKARGLYDRRVSVHGQLKDLFNRNDVLAYADLALGITNSEANYSASDHPRKLGPLILQSSKASRVFALADQFMRCNDALEIPDIIYRADLPYLKISVGSEMAAMLRPEVFWVTNIRTLWASHVVEDRGDTGRANELLRLYRQQEEDYRRDPGRHRPFDYSTWRALHPMVGEGLSGIAQIASVEAAEQSVQLGDLTFLWADAVADTTYNQYGWTGKPSRRQE
jgi:hypothetical protein